MDNAKLVEVIRQEPKVREMFQKDENTEMSVVKIEGHDFQKLASEFPQIFSVEYPYIYAINLISSKMMNNNSYWKLKMYITPQYEIFKKFSNF